MRGSRLLRPAAALLAASGLLFPFPARAAEGEAEAAWWRGLRLADALGDLDGALVAFREAAASGAPSRRAAALLREAAVLRRLGHPADAGAVLRGLLADPVLSDLPAARGAARAALESLRDAEPPAPPAETPELRLLREQQRAHEGEMFRLRHRLDEALERSADVEPLREELRRAYDELEELRRRLRDAEREARGETGALSEREREERDREDARARRDLSEQWTRFGKEQYLAGRFEDARKFLREAVELDPGNAAARDLLARVSAPTRDRERIARSILEVLALEQELRADQLRAEGTALVEEGRRILGAGDPGAALERLDAALGRIAAQPDLVDRVADLREQAAGLFDEAARRSGSPRRAPAPPAPVPEDPRWQEAVRAVLEKAGSAGESGGAALRMFPLGPILRAQRESLPPAPEPGLPRRGWSLSAEVPPLGPVLRAAVRGAVEPAAWTAPGAVLEGVGATLVARAGGKTLEALEATVRSLSEPPGRSLLVRATALPCEPAALVEALARAGRTLNPVRDGTGAAAVLDAAAVDAVLREFGAASPAETVFRVPERRGFSLAVLRPREGAAMEEEAPGIRLSGLAWTLPDGGLAAGLALEGVLPGARGAAALLGAASLARQEAWAGGTLRPGGGILVAGLSDPFAGEGRGDHLAVLVRFGEAGPAAAAGENGSLVLPLADLASRNPDRPGPLTAPPPDPRAGRAEAIRRWLERRAPEGVEVLVEGSGLRVRGPAAAAGLVAADLRRLADGSPPVPVEARAYLLDAREEAALLRGLPLLSPEPGSPLRAARVAGEERRTRRFLLEGGGGRVSLGGEGPVEAAPAQRVAFGRVEETAGAGKGSVAGLECGVRVWPGDLPGERWIWVDAAVRRAAEGEAEARPAARVALRPGDAILVVGIDNPFPPAGGRTRVALWVEAGSGP